MQNETGPDPLLQCFFLAPFKDLTCKNVLSGVVGQWWPSSIKGLYKTAARDVHWQLDDVVSCSCCSFILSLTNAFAATGATKSRFDIRHHVPPSLRPTPAGFCPTFLILIACDLCEYGLRFINFCASKWCFPAVSNLSWLSDADSPHQLLDRNQEGLLNRCTKTACLLK